MRLQLMYGNCDNIQHSQSTNLLLRHSELLYFGVVCNVHTIFSDNSKNKLFFIVIEYFCILTVGILFLLLLLILLFTSGQNVGNLFCFECCVHRGICFLKNKCKKRSKM